MKIVVLGTRGFPSIPGGVETHSEELYTRIAGRGHEVTVIRRKPYVSEKNRDSKYKGVSFVDMYAPRIKSAEALTHTFMGIFKARRLKPDILHIHAIGPSLLTPLARMLGMKVVVTNHGPDYNRKKWGGFAKWILRGGERAGTRRAHGLIAISESIGKRLEEKYGRKDIDIIYNGVNAPTGSTSGQWLNTLGLTDTKYIFTAGRFVEEKGFHDLIEAYEKSGLAEAGVKLVIAGDADYPDAYSDNLKKQAREAGAIMTGFIKGEPLEELLSNASLFVLPSYHEGLPIALLEAMSHRRNVLVSDIEGNRLGQLLPERDFFEAGNIGQLSEALKRKLGEGADREYDMTPYDWDKIAERTIGVYEKVMNRKRSARGTAWTVGTIRNTKA